MSGCRVWGVRALLRLSREKGNKAHVGKAPVGGCSIIRKP